MGGEAYQKRLIISKTTKEAMKLVKNFKYDHSTLQYVNILKCKCAHLANEYKVLPVQTKI
jgi:poly(A) polymerase Pap1